MTTSDPAGPFGICADCGAIVPGDRQRCALCRSDPLPQPDPATGDIPHPGLRHPYRPAGTLAIALRMMFSAWLILEAFAVGSLIVLYRVVDALAANPFAYAFETFDRQLGIWDSISVVEVGFTVVLAFLFISWMFRAYGNLPALGALDPSYVRGWAIGGWFIPIGNLWIPKRIADDIWRSSGSDVRAGRGWRLEPVDLRVHLWWVSFVVGRIVLSVANASVDDGATPGAIRNALVWLLAGVVLEMAAAVLAIWLVCTASARQATRVAATGRSVADRRPTRRLGWHLAATPITAAAIAFAGYLVFDIGAPVASAGAAQGDGTARYEGYGISFAYDDSFTAVELGLIGDTPSESEGSVIMATPDQSTVAVVTWVEIPAGRFDPESAVDLIIDNAADMLGDDPLVVRGAAVELTGGPATFLAKTFRVDGDLGFLSGAVAAGTCAGDRRGIQMALLEDGVMHIDAAGEEGANPHLQELRAILATLDC
ncbi:MAG: DUF4328 domain-containing protein [Actinobacteria bacterium]|nr:DUF4328 domain-containing protein [Actinomycetota bacterium]MBU1492370.1 DUF4328 domain-containing protein [Actinomycetota bacterium]MBU1865558.1 DUF4328 domain-containing protein [Actinomycetota bacterium]